MFRFEVLAKSSEGNAAAYRFGAMVHKVCDTECSRCEEVERSIGCAGVDERRQRVTQDLYFLLDPTRALVKL